MLDALARFYRAHHDLTTETITAERALQQTSRSDQGTELAAIESELTKTGVAIDRYLSAFERGTLRLRPTFRVPFVESQ